MIFDAHLHFSPTDRKPRSQTLVGGVAISKSFSENDWYVRTAAVRGLACAIFVGGTNHDLVNVLRWITDGHAWAYDHVEMQERFDPKIIRPTLDASRQAGKPVILHLSRHDHVKTSHHLVEACLDYVTAHFPDLKVIVAHLAGENLGSALKFAASNPNIFFDISRLAQTAERLGMVSPSAVLASLKESIPATRIVFGSDNLDSFDSTTSVEFKTVTSVFSTVDSDCIFLTNGCLLFKTLVAPS